MSKIKNFDDFLNENFLSLEESEKYAIIEEAIQNLNEDEEINEGWKEIVFAGLLSLLTIGGIQAQTIKTVDRKVTSSGLFGRTQNIDLTKAFKFKLDSTMTKEKADSVIAKMLKKGWSLKASEMDTLWEKTVKEAPETIVSTISVKFDSDAYFASGKFDLDSAMKSDINTALESVVKLSGTLTKINIISSTDKQGISKGLQAKLKSMDLTPDNAGLSKARSGNVKNYLTEQGVNASLIETKNLAEEGSGEIDASARYVMIEIVYIQHTTEKLPPAPTKQTVDYTVYLQKNLTSKKSFNFKFPHLFKNHGKISNFSKRTSIGCPMTRF
jgi:flagellar motor protein MotB